MPIDNQYSTHIQSVQVPCKQSAQVPYPNVSQCMYFADNILYPRQYSAQVSYRQNQYCAMVEITASISACNVRAEGCWKAFGGFWQALGTHRRTRTTCILWAQGPCRSTHGLGPRVHAWTRARWCYVVCGQRDRFLLALQQTHARAVPTHVACGHAHLLHSCLMFHRLHDVS